MGWVSVISLVAVLVDRLQISQWVKGSSSRACMCSTQSGEDLAKVVISVNIRTLGYLSGRVLECFCK